VTDYIHRHKNCEEGVLVTAVIDNTLQLESAILFRNTETLHNRRFLTPDLLAGLDTSHGGQ
jgi:hypothetical protein